MAYMSFAIRSNVYPPPYDGMHYYNTAQTKVYLDNYKSDGFWHVWGGQIKNFKSVEHGSHFSRHIYGDFPPGQPAVTYGLFNLFKISNTEGNLIKLNQTIQVISGFTLVITVFLLCSLFLSPFLSLTYTTLASSFLLFQPAFNYWLDPVFQYQSLSTLYISVILLLLALEMTYGKTKLPLNIPLSILLFLGLTTDAIFVFFTPCLFFMALIAHWRGEKHEVTKLVAIIIAAMLASVANIAYWYGIGFLDNVAGLLEHRLSLSTEGKEELSLGSFIKMFVRQYSAEMLVILAVGPLLLLLHQTQRNETKEYKHVIRSSSLVMLLPTLLYLFVFPNAFSSHELFHIHFIFPLLFINFILIPKLINLFSAANRAHFFHLLFSLFLAFFAYNSAQSIFFQYPQLGVKNALAAKFIGEHYQPGDVFFSPNFRITSTPPQLQSISKTLVYPIQSISEIDKFDNCMATHFPERSYNKKIFFNGPHILMKDLDQDTKLPTSKGKYEVYVLEDSPKHKHTAIDNAEPRKPSTPVFCGNIDKKVFGTGTVWMVWHPSVIEVLREMD